MATEYLTMAEIEAKYPNEWVLIDRPTVNRMQQVLGGYLVAHSPDRDESDRQSLNATGLSNVTACFFTGKPDPNEVWLL